MIQFQALRSDECEETCDCSCVLSQELALGPEIYHVTRTRSGVDQTGTLYGGRLTYERLKPWGFYLAFDGLYAKGTLRGSSEFVIEDEFGDEPPEIFVDHLRSTLTDFNVEGRIGFTVQFPILFQPTITPFVGYGYFEETLKFHFPTPIEAKYTTYYDYFALGFLSKIYQYQYMTTGFNFKIRYSWNTRCEVTDDPEPEFNDQVMLVDDDYSYRFELPIVVQPCSCTDRISISLTPFYEHRHYGGRENFPADFLDTTLKIYGANLQLIINF
jgi:hypothetical protein